MASHLIRLQGELKALIREIESNPDVIGSDVFARAKAAANSDHVEWTANFLEVVARMRVYQRQYAAFKPGKPKIDAYNNAEVAGVMIDEMLKHMGIIPGRLPDPVDGLFANFENEGG